MSRKQRYTAAEVIAALKKTKGMVYLAANELECSHTTIYNYMKRYVSVREEHEYQRGELLDIAEIKLREAVISGQPWALQFALRCLGKDRGYTERQEVTGAEGGAVVVRYTGNVDPGDV